MTDDGRTTTGERTPNAHDNDFKNKTKQKQKTNTTDARTVYENTHARERGTRGGRRRVLDPFTPPSASKKKMKKICTRARARSGKVQPAARARAYANPYTTQTHAYIKYMSVYIRTFGAFIIYIRTYGRTRFFLPRSRSRVFFFFFRVRSELAFEWQCRPTSQFNARSAHPGHVLCNTFVHVSYTKTLSLDNT